MRKTGSGRLDRSKPFGEVIGESETRYQQDHKDYDGQGHELLPEVADAPKAAAPAPQPLVTDTQPPLNDGAEVGTAGDDLDDMSMSQLRATYIEEFEGKKCRVGPTKVMIADMIRVKRAEKLFATNDEA